MSPLEMALLGAGVAGAVALARELYLRSLSRQDLGSEAVTSRLDRLEAIIHENREHLVKLETQMATQSPFFTALQSRLIDALHHPDPAKGEMDGLLEKLKKLTLTPEEQARLEVLLREQADHPKTDVYQQQQSRVLLAIMPLVIEEAKLDQDASQQEAEKPVHPQHQPSPLSRAGLFHAPDQAAEAFVAIAKDTNTRVTATQRVAQETYDLVVELHDQPKGPGAA